MDRIEKTYLIAAPVEEVWRALTDPQVIAEWSHAPAEYIAEPGTTYSLWNGDIQGEILEVAPQERLVKTWQPANWATSDSKVTFFLVPQGDSTRVDLIHENVEAFDLADTDEGWDIYYLGVIKEMLESGAGRPTAGESKLARKGVPSKSGAVKAGVAKKPVAKKSPGKKSAAKKGSTKRAAAKKGAAKKGTSKRGAARKRSR